MIVLHFLYIPHELIQGFFYQPPLFFLRLSHSKYLPTLSHRMKQSAGNRPGLRPSMLRNTPLSTRCSPINKSITAALSVLSFAIIEYFKSFLRSSCSPSAES